MSKRPPAVTPEDRLYRIVEEGLCIGCGLCQAVAGPDQVEVRKAQNGELRPHVVGALNQETVDRIYDVCPGTRLEGLPERLVDDDSHSDLVWGPYRRMLLAHASDPEIRFKGAAGGVLTALALFLLESKRVDFVLHVRAGRLEPTFGESHSSRKRADVLVAAGSRYGPTAPLIDIDRVLDHGQSFAFVGKPCDIAALRNLARHDPRVDDLLRYWLTPVCGGFMPSAGMADFLQRNEGVGLDAVTAFRYRGHGCPGPTRYELADGRVRELRYTDFWGTDESQWTLPFRCKVCPDGIGEAADIAAADNWPGGAPNPETEDQDPGTNAVIARTASGAALMQAAVEAGYVTLEGEVDPRHMDRIQPHQTRKKLAVRARWDGLAAEGRLVPRSARLRLDALSQEAGEAAYREQLEGMRERVRRGKADEERPAPRSRTSGS